jgi:hypothetical protein
MKTHWTLLVFAFALVSVAPASAQETLSPIPISNGQTTRYTIDDQAITISAAGVAATVYLTTVSGQLVAGVVERTSSGTTQGQVLICWENVNKAAAVWIDPQTPSAGFEMRQLGRRRPMQLRH